MLELAAADRGRAGRAPLRRPGAAVDVDPADRVRLLQVLQRKRLRSPAGQPGARLPDQPWPLDRASLPSLLGACTGVDVVLNSPPYLVPINKWREWKLRDARHTTSRWRRAGRGHTPAATRLRHPLGFRDVFAESATHGRSSDGEVVIETRGLAKRFGEREALKGVSFDAHRGELLAVIGPNGAGKTTLLSILAGIRRPDGGIVSRPPGEIGWVPQQAALYRRLTVIENLRLFARLEKVPDTDAAVEEMLDQTGLAERRDDQVGTLSGGNQQRINIAIGLLARPAVLLLDEPSAGLDPRQRERLWEFVLGLAGGGHDGDLLHPQHRRGRALRPATAGAGRRRGAVRRHARASCMRRCPSRARATSSRRSSPSCGTEAIEPSGAAA